jgi:hypothetical protein
MPKVKIYKKNTHHFAFSYKQEKVIRELDICYDGLPHILCAKIKGRFVNYTECTTIKYAAQTNLDFAADHKRRFSDSEYLGVGIIYSIDGVIQ